MHFLFRHILLCKHNGKFLCAVVAIVEEDDNIAFFNTSVNVSVNEGFHKLVRILVLLRVSIVTTLYTFYHIGYLASLAFNQLVVSNLYAIPTLITIHCVEAANDACNVCPILIAYSLQLADKALTALGVSITTVHKAVNVSIVSYTVFLCNLDEFEKVIERRVYTTC